MAHRYRINELKIKPGEDRSALLRAVERKAGLRPGTLSVCVRRAAELRPGAYMILRESIDARDKNDLHYVYTVEFETAKPLRTNRTVQAAPEQARREVPMGSEPLAGRPVIVGFGPCGIFAALELAKRGYRPIVLERGSSMEKRIADVDRFRETGVLDPSSNMLFGEGGAGTFSDGKLASGIKSGNIRYVLETFYDAGADEDILYKARPHIGTDVLRRVIVTLRRQIEALGGEVRFDTVLTDLTVADGRLTGVTVRCGQGEEYEITTNALVLATGHSARDTFQLLHQKGFAMEQKPISIGVRMEHPQALIDVAQYGAAALEQYDLPPAEYKLSYRAESGRGVYSFCMCPGGEVVVCSTRDGELYVNGMSNKARDSGTANSGILCDVRCEDYAGDDPLAGVRFQEKYERLAYENATIGAGGWQPPTCTMAAFMQGAEAPAVPVASTVPSDTGRPSDADRVVNSLPPFAVEAIREAVPHFAYKITGYDSPAAVVKAVETRSSSPVRVLRDKAGRSNVDGVYPAGEGAGYAGGITSAACDGIRAAEHIIARFRPMEEPDSES
ncbi:MAG: NAD(FAD)-utilizing dehydrogenase [Mogibacterium sp.]|nr:NAD(FAD)-utilizing dehydrogenase [Mogibacterium sp.]